MIIIQQLAVGHLRRLAELVDDGFLPQMMLAKHGNKLKLMQRNCVPPKVKSLSLKL